MTIPIKYIEENLVFNKNGDCYAYYEFIPYNYSFLSQEKKEDTFNNLRKLIAHGHDSNLHFLYLGTEESIADVQERSKKWVKGNLKEEAYAYIDSQTDYLTDIYGENEVDVKFYVGFKLVLNEEDVTIQSAFKEFITTIKDFFNSVNQTVLNDYATMDNDFIERYMRLENLLESKVTNRFKMRRLKESDFAYILEHLHGMKGVAYNDYSFQPSVDKLEKETLYKVYDYINLSGGVEEKNRMITFTHENNIQHAAYLTISKIVGESSFPDSEILFYQQQTFDYPVDVSINIETIGNRKALSTIRNKKKELVNLDENAGSAGSDSSGAFYTAQDDAEELEDVLDKTKENMYKISYVIRVYTENELELAKRVSEVKDFYHDYHIILQRPYGDQLGLHSEFIPGVSRYMNDYVQYVTSDFLASLGFGSNQMLGETEGMAIGFNVDTGKTVRILPHLAAQSVEGANTRALAKALIGSLGGGKSMAENIMLFLTALFGGQLFIIDPKSERGNWKEDLPMITDAINIIDLTSDDENSGLLDPFTFLDRKEAEELAIEVLTFLTGITPRDAKRFPLLRQHVAKVTDGTGGLLTVIDELKETNTPESIEMAYHIESFTDLSFAKLLFSHGRTEKSLDITNIINIFQIQELTLPDPDTEVENYSSGEILSIAMMLVIISIGLKFIRSNDARFKVVALEEAWSTIQFAQGKTMANKLIREGRAKNSAADLITQNADDLAGEKMKNNIGMKFAFKSTDSVEIEKTLTFFGLETNSENIDAMKNLEMGQCLFQDIYGRVGIIEFDTMFEDIFNAFDTRPPVADFE